MDEEGAVARAKKSGVMDARRSGRVRRSAGVIGLGVALACALLASSIAVGLRTASVKRLPELPHEVTPDYGATFGSPVAPLRRDFVREALGLSEVAPDTGSSPVTSRKAQERDRRDPPRVRDAHPFTNDDIDDAHQIRAIPFTAETDTSTATRETGEPTQCSPAGGGTAWYRFQAPRSESLVATSFGTDYAVRIGVFERASDGSFEMVGCDDDVAGAALVQFDAVAETTYFFQVAAQATGGRLVFNLEPTGTTTLVSTTPDGRPGSFESFSGSVSADGRLVAFESYSPDIAPNTPDNPCRLQRAPQSLEEAEGDYVVPCKHIYVRDQVTRVTRLVSVSSTGEPAEWGAYNVWGSGDGRFVTFVSPSANLIPGDTNAAPDVFVHDLWTGRTERVSIASDGQQARFDPQHRSYNDALVDGSSISDDGRYVAFASYATNLVPGDTNGARDVFVHDRRTHRTERASLTFDGRQSGGSNSLVSISPDGRYVAFTSDASDLVANDTNGARDLFLHDRLTHKTEMVSVSASGSPGNGTVEAGWTRQVPVISRDGRYVVFSSSASNLVPGDTNGKNDVFVRDRFRQTTFRVSVSSTGGQGNDGSFDGTISRDGRYVAFTSAADRLEQGGRSSPITQIEDLYVHDLATHTTVRMPVTPRGESGLVESRVVAPFLSADGRTMTFASVCYDVACESYGNLIQAWVHQRPKGGRS